MSDFEIYYLYSETLSRESQVFMDFVTILFAFIVTGFAGGKYLTHRVMPFLIGAYCLIEFLIITNVSMVMGDIAGLIGEMKARKAAGSAAFDWVDVIAAPDMGVALSGAGTHIVMISAFLGSLWFFIDRRKQALRDLAAEAGPVAVEDAVVKAAVTPEKHEEA